MTKGSPKAPRPNPGPARQLPATPAPAVAWPRSRVVLMAATLGLVTILLYWPATHCDFVVFDDPGYVAANPQVLGGLTRESMAWAFTNVTADNWHPLTWCSLMLDASLFGTSPAGFHFTNLVLHAVAAILLFWLLLRMTGTPWRSATVAAFFAWHPLHVESVAWVSERKDVLSACFGFLTLLFYVCYAQACMAGSREQGAGRSDNPDSKAPRSLLRAPCFYCLSLFCFADGLLSKPMLVTWPFVLLLLDYWPLNRFPPLQPSAFGLQLFRRWWPLIREKIPFLGLAAAACIVTYLVQSHAGAVVSVVVSPLGSRIGNSLISYCLYLGKLFWPANLGVLYTHKGYWPLASVLLAAIFLGGLSAWFWVRRARWQFLLVGWLWFLGTLVPVIGWVQVGEQSMADRYAYLPSVGILVLAVWGVSEFTRRWRSRTLALSLLAAGSLGVCLALTPPQIATWKDSETLFRQAVTVNPNSYTVRNNLGNLLLARGQIDDAIAQYQAALRLWPDYALARFDLGIALDKLGRTDDAIRECLQAIQLMPGNARLHSHLGLLMLRRDRIEEALTQFHAALLIQPNFPRAHYNLGLALMKQGQPEAAISEFKAALGDTPDLPDAHYNLGEALLQQGQLDPAIQEFQETLRLKPEFPGARSQLGSAYYKHGEPKEAINQFQAAVADAPDDIESRVSLGTLLNEQGQTDAAISQFQEAIRLQPDHAGAHFNLGVILLKQGRNDEAISQFEETLRLKPNDPGTLNYLANAKARKNQPVAQ